MKKPRKEPACACRAPRASRDCSYCGVTTHSGGKVCGICWEAGIDGGGVIRGTERRTCLYHSKPKVTK